MKQNWMDVSPGLRVTKEWPGFDWYVGTPEALAEAGLVRPDQFPGQPGMRKTIVTILSDGTIPGGPPTASDQRSKEPGAMKIERAGKGSYHVRINVSWDEYDRRVSAERESNFELERSVEREKSRAHLKLVWSAPNSRRTDAAGKFTW